VRIWDVLMCDKWMHKHKQVAVYFSVIHFLRRNLKLNRILRQQCEKLGYTQRASGLLKFSCSLHTSKVFTTINSFSVWNIFSYLDYFANLLCFSLSQQSWCSQQDREKHTWCHSPHRPGPSHLLNKNSLSCRLWTLDVYHKISYPCWKEKSKSKVQMRGKYLLCHDMPVSILVMHLKNKYYRPK